MEKQPPQRRRPGTGRIIPQFGWLHIERRGTCNEYEGGQPARNVAGERERSRVDDARGLLAKYSLAALDFSLSYIR